MWLCCAKTAERIGVVFRVETLGGPTHFVLDGDSDPCTANGPVIRGKFSPLCSTGTLLFGFDVAFAKLLWPLVVIIIYIFSFFIYKMLHDKILFV